LSYRADDRLERDSIDVPAGGSCARVFIDISRVHEIEPVSEDEARPVRLKVREFRYDAAAIDTARMSRIVFRRILAVTGGALRGRRRRLELPCFACARRRTSGLPRAGLVAKGAEFNVRHRRSTCGYTVERESYPAQSKQSSSSGSTGHRHCRQPRTPPIRAYEPAPRLQILDAYRDSA
jgi:hypothetical protein